jgi:hypothetical protein
MTPLLKNTTFIYHFTTESVTDTCSELQRSERKLANAPLHGTAQVSRCSQEIKRKTLYNKLAYYTTLYYNLNEIIVINGLSHKEGFLNYKILQGKMLQIITNYQPERVNIKL